MNILVTLIFFILTITWSWAYGCGQQQNRQDKKCRQIDDDFNGHGSAPVRRGAHCPMEHIQGFSQRPWGECRHHIAPVAAMVDEFEWNTQNTNKTQLFASNYGTFWLLVVCENFNPKTDPLLSSLMRQALFKCETPRLELKSLQSFLAIIRFQGTKSKKVSKLARSFLIKVAHICANRDIPVKRSRSSLKSWAHICAHRG